MAGDSGASECDAFVPRGPGPIFMGLTLTVFDIIRSAPASGRAEIILDAHPALAWEVVSSVELWPAWASDIKWINAGIPLVPGTAFEMRSAGQTVHGCIKAVDAPRMLCWTSSSLAGKACHRIELEAVGSRTRVIATASYRSLWAWVLPRQARRHIKASLSRALQDLKTETESRPIFRKAA